MIKLLQKRREILELFLLVNLSFLALDIYVAHSMNDFHHQAEWIPFYFSLLAPLPLIIEFIINLKREKPIALPGKIVGYTAIAVGIAGLFFHLDSNFFDDQTIKNLVYTAPFIAPLSYCAIGFLLLLNRMVETNSREWCEYLVFFGLMGFAGNFILAVCDHAQNGFYYYSEWIPVYSAAIATGVLSPIFFRNYTSNYIKLSLFIMLLQVVVGVMGFILHGLAVTKGVSSSFFENIVHTAPIFAPLLFVNLAMLSSYGLYLLFFHLEEDQSSTIAVDC